MVLAITTVYPNNLWWVMIRKSQILQCMYKINWGRVHVYMYVHLVNLRCDIYWFCGYNLKACLYVACKPNTSCAWTAPPQPNRRIDLYTLLQLLFINNPVKWRLYMCFIGALEHFVKFSWCTWRICGTLVQFGCYQHRYEWKDLWCSSTVWLLSA